MPEWLMGADCKSADECLRWFKSSSAQLVLLYMMGFHYILKRNGHGRVTWFKNWTMSSRKPQKPFGLSKRALALLAILIGAP